LVWSYGGDKGSVFFDRLIEGIRTAQADPKNVILVQDRYGKIVQRESIVRLGHLLTYLDDEVATENTKRDVNKQFALPWSGSMMPPPAISEGGFFFLSPIWTPSGLAADPVSVPTGSTSVIPGRPDLKVFKTDPTAYAIKGIDLSHYNGSVDWPTLATSGYSFAYLKATEGASFQDTSFKPNWGASGSTNIVRGAYHTFRFCSTVDAQIANFMSMNPVDTSTLPPAVDIEPAGAASYQTALDKPVGGCVVKNIEDERLALLDFLEKIQQKTGKVPVIFGASDVFRDLIDARFKKFNFWIAQYRATGGPDITLPGETPWTLWQHSSYAKVAGIQGDTDENVFFGNQADFQAFVAGRANPALAAVRSSN
jgi:lysozyme